MQNVMQLFKWLMRFSSQLTKVLWWVVKYWKITGTAALCWWLGWQMGKGLGRTTTEITAKAPKTKSLLSKNASKKAVWSCAAHPQIKRQQAGTCSICYRTLIRPRKMMGKQARNISISATAKALAHIRTSVVKRRPLSKQHSFLGKVTLNQRKTQFLKMPHAGRVQRLKSQVVGQKVKKGQNLAKIESALLLAAQFAYLQALETERITKALNDIFLQQTARFARQEAEQQLHKFGLPQKAFQELQKHKRIYRKLQVQAPFSGQIVRIFGQNSKRFKKDQKLYQISDLTSLWVTAKIIRKTLASIQLGQSLKIQTIFEPRKQTQAKVVYIAPFLNSKQQYTELRLLVKNTKRTWKPGMEIKVIQNIHFGSKISSSLKKLGSGKKQIIPAKVIHPLTIPVSAPIILGQKVIVYVRKKKDLALSFQGKIITLGPRLGNYYIVYKGLKAGDVVVTNGAYQLETGWQLETEQ